jgi:hypothetical protein
MARDFLDEIEAERTASNPKFPGLVGEAARRRKLARKLVAIREKKHLTVKMHPMRRRCARRCCAPRRDVRR